MSYTPSQEILDRYADVLVNFALNSGLGVKKGQVVLLEVPECAKPLLVSLQKTVLRAGAHYITNFIPDGIARDFYELAQEHQLGFFPHALLKGRVEQIDHSIVILAETNKRELEGIAPGKIIARSSVFKPYKQWREEKEALGNFTWTLGLYGTEAMAREAGLSLEDYWAQIIKACYLDSDRSLEEWRKSFDEVDRVKDALNALEIQKLNLRAEGTDLMIGLGSGREWLGGSGRNVPSFEVFISPDCRLTEGHVSFDMPLYRYGNLIEGVSLVFKEGKVVEAHATKGEELLKEMIGVEGADKIGEYSLTDSRLSRIDKFMAETLYDENFGGAFGNTHLALGSAYKDSYPGDASSLTKEQWDALGYNDSVVHTDIISTKNREVTAWLPDGGTRVIYKDGHFLI